MTATDESIRPNEDISEGWVPLEASTAFPVPPEHQEHEDDDSLSETSSDSAFGSYPSSTESMTSSIFDYCEIHGREYHSERWNSGYCFPIDQQQLDAQYLSGLAVHELLGGQLHLADLKEAEKPIQSVLDVGSGEGCWAFEFADDNPGVLVTATDLSPIAPKLVAPNLRFELDDCTQRWSFDDSDFDFIHMRNLVGSIKDWPHLFQEAFRCTSPGGFTESHEHSFIFQSDNGSIEPKSALERMGDVFKEAGVKSGYSFAVVDESIQRKGMEEAGFIDVKEEVKKMPISKEHEDEKLRKMSKIAYDALLCDLEGYVSYVTGQVLGWPRSETEVLAMEVRKDLGQMDIYVHHKIVVGRKPFEKF
ncbi:hypothetical protein NCS52_01519600 [Fusarium sp. LHS14.1]|nr:hypothetical protein NCS52_01519600 [Fusarium sp. LHS14.1]